jgi:hypothetical protein
MLHTGENPSDVPSLTIRASWRISCTARCGRGTSSSILITSQIQEAGTVLVDAYVPAARS